MIFRRIHAYSELGDDCILIPDSNANVAVLSPPWWCPTRIAIRFAGGPGLVLFVVYLRIPEQLAVSIG